MTVTYRSSGVDVAAAESWLAKNRSLIRSISRPEVLPDRGQFAGLFRLASLRLRDPVLVASTDGVGTKLKVAQAAGAHEAIGIDVVAMNVNDIVIYGAQPLFFLDYLAVGKIQPAIMTPLLRGIVEGCRQSGCALLGGETAEMPGVYRSGEYDVAGFCVGVVERSRIINGSRVRAGDRILGLASSGVHANGFSLVRRVFSKSQLVRLRRELLTPTRIYVTPLLEVLEHVDVHAIAHITGGGLARRLPSLIPTSRRQLQAHVTPGSWPVPPIFQAIQDAGGVTMDEMMGTFNMGIGMALACAPHDVARMTQIMRRAEIPTWVIGTIERVRS